MKSKLFGSTIGEKKVFFADLKKLLSLKPEQIIQIAAHMDSEEGFYLSNEKIEELAQTVGLEGEFVADVVNIARHIYRSATEKHIGVGDIVGDLKNLAGKWKAEIPKGQAEALKVLFQPKEKYDRHRMSRTYRDGVVPNLNKISFVWDWRPVFKEKGAEIIEWIPILIARFRTRTDSNQDDDMVFQLDEETFKKMKEVIEEMSEKLVQAKKHFCQQTSQKAEGGKDNA